MRQQNGGLYFLACFGPALYADVVCGDEHNARHTELARDEIARHAAIPQRLAEQRGEFLMHANISTLIRIAI